MGNECQQYILSQHTQLPVVQSSSRKLKQVNNAPDNSYAIRLKNSLPELQQPVKNTYDKIWSFGKTISDVKQLIKRCPVYYIYAISAVYQGQWKNGEPHGYGTVIYTDYSLYEGLFDKCEASTFINQKHQENAIYIFPDGSYYTGGFKDSLFHGFGKLVKKDNQLQIQGQFEKGLPHGIEITQKIDQKITKNGQQTIIKSQYKGKYKQGKKHGYGILKTESCRRQKGKDNPYEYHKQKWQYKGYFQNGMFHGDGDLEDQHNEVRYKGRFEQGKRRFGQMLSEQGILKYNYVEGSDIKGYFQWKDRKKFYVGEIKNDMLDGKGTIYFEDGKAIYGEWQKGSNILVKKVEEKNQSELKTIKQEVNKKFDKLTNQKFDKLKKSQI